MTSLLGYGQPQVIKASISIGGFDITSAGLDGNVRRQKTCSPSVYAAFDLQQF